MNSGHVCIEVPRPTLRALSGAFPDGVTVLVVPPEAVAPVFVRLPGEDEVCPVTGLPGATLKGLLKQAGPDRVRTHQLRKRGATRGPVLVERAGLIAFVKSLPPAGWQQAREEVAAA